MELRMFKKLWKLAHGLLESRDAMHLHHGLTRYHCCIQKTASQWFAGLFEDPEFRELSGISESKRPGINFLRKDETTRSKLGSVPTGTLVSPVYIEYQDFLANLARGPYLAVAVVRDPRDIVVSGYFSVAQSHKIINEDIASRRQDYLALGPVAGMAQQIEDGVSYYQALRSWIPARTENKVRVFRYEDLFGPNHVEVMEDFLRALAIFLTPADLRRLCDKHSFEAKTGRQRGEEDLSKHYRKGVAGDWKNHLTEEHLQRLETLCGDVLDAFGYR